MSDKRKRILAIIDPTRGDQWALRKAVMIAENRDDTDVCAFLCVYSEADYAEQSEFQTVELGRHTVWLRGMIDDIAAQGFAIEPVVVWNHDWVQAICIAAINADIGLVVKRASGRPNSLASSDRRLIRKLNRELLLVKNDPVTAMKRILIAVDFNAEDESHKALNEAVVAMGNRICGGSSDIELHSVSAYVDSDLFVHPPDVAKMLDIDRSRVHVKLGSAAEVIPATASKIDADLVVIGNMGRAGLSGITIGNTAEKILADIRSDVVVLVRSDEEQRSAA